MPCVGLTRVSSFSFCKRIGQVGGQGRGSDGDEVEGSLDAFHFLVQDWVVDGHLQKDGCLSLYVGYDTRTSSAGLSIYIVFNANSA